MRRQRPRYDMRRLVAGAMSAALMSTAFAAAAAPPKIGFSSPFLSDPFQAILVNQTIAAIKADGMEALPGTNANGDAAKQATDVRNLISSGANALIVNPADSEAIVPVVKYANDKNVPIVMIDIAPAGGKTFMIVRADNKAIGAKACEAVGKAIGGKGKVLSLMGDQATTNGRDRTTGFNDCMKAKFPDVTAVIAHFLSRRCGPFLGVMAQHPGSESLDCAPRRRDDRQTGV